MQKKLPKVYLFIDCFSPLDLNGLNKNISIIYRNYKKKVDESTLISLKNYCKLNKRELYLALNIKLAIKHKLDGVYIPSFVKTKNFNFYPKPKNFLIIGSAHNNKEIKTKEIQGASAIFLSSIFKQNKNFLGINKFKLLSKTTDRKIIALGGISEKNFKQLKLVNCFGFGGISFFK